MKLDNFATVSDAVTRQMCEVYIGAVLDNQDSRGHFRGPRAARVALTHPAEARCIRCRNTFVEMYSSKGRAKRAQAQLKYCRPCLKAE